MSRSSSSTMIWVQHPDLAWTTATLDSKASEPGKIGVKLTINGALMSLPGPKETYDQVTREELECKCENLVELERINEGIILHHVKTRYSSRKIYTFVDNILVAVNPYQSLPELYKDDMMDKIRRRVNACGKLIPHVYTIAATAMTDMTNRRGDQSVLISGESGSGKTETTKKLLQFLSNSAGKKSTVDISSAILDSNPITEAFGNAKTLRNNNSSRFGKYMEVNYKQGDRRGEIIGCKCKSYLLEKSRVVQQMKGERNYHVFYMLLAGADAAMQEEYKLKSPTEFLYLNQSGCLDIAGRDDREEFNLLSKSFEHVSFSENQKRQILQCLAGILHLGNVQFVDVNQTEQVINPLTGLTEEKVIEGTRGAVAKSSHKDLQIAVRLLEMFDSNDSKGAAVGLEKGADSLEQALCFIMIRGATSTVKSSAGEVEYMKRPLSAAQAANNRDALAKAVYDKIFDKIIYQVNKSLFKSRDEGWNIGILDIFGFEVFEVNSFEQLCINYCNEKLQTFFNDVIFASELKYYKDEGVDVDDITYKDNVGCVSLIDAKAGGMFSLVADIAVNVNATDDDLCKRFIETYLEKGVKNEYFARNKKRGSFGIKHFAGDVVYCVDGFIEKNKDKLPDAVASATERSTLPILNEDADAWDLLLPGMSARKSYPHPSSLREGKRDTATRLPLASKFKLDLELLVTDLRKTTPQFIRCVKPNERQQPSLMEPILTLNQLKYSGLFEAIRIRKSGYPQRMSHDQFLSRYKHCILTITASQKVTTESYVKALMETLAAKIKFSNKPGEPRNYAIGLTKVFIRKEAMGHKLDEYREANSEHIAIPIQKMIRGWLAKRRFYKLVGYVKQMEMITRRNEEKERELMGETDRASLKFNIKRRQSDARKIAIEREKVEQKRLMEARELAINTKLALVCQRLFHMWKDGVKGRRHMCVRVLEIALNDDTARCIDCTRARPCTLHHTRECNTLNLRRHLQESLDKKNSNLLQDAIRCADDSCVSPSTKCAVLHVKSEGTKNNNKKNSFRPVLLPTPRSNPVEPSLCSLYGEVLRELQKHKREGSITKAQFLVRPSMHCDCRLVLLQRAIARPPASCKVCRSHDTCIICNPKDAPKRTRNVHSHRCIKSKKIAALQSAAKSTILAALSESYIKQALKDAVDSGSDILLLDAIEKADASNMSTTESIAGIYRVAKEALADHTRLKATIGTLTSELNKSTSVPKLLANVDIIRKHVVEARNMGLGGEPAVAEAVTRVGKIKGLIALRDKLRMAIEICSPSLMDIAMKEREKLLPFFGEELLKDEAWGVTEMRRMIGYLTQINDISPEEEEKHHRDHTGDDEGGVDRMLPRYVSHELEAIRDANPQNEHEVEDAMSKFVTLVPNEAVRKRYRRMFKWVVAYAPWKYSRPELTEIVDVEVPVELTVDRYGRKKFQGAAGKAELKFLASRYQPGVAFASPVAKLKLNETEIHSMSKRPATAPTSNPLLLRKSKN